jgi:flagella basal body P-ring formation protein FlgA
MFNFYLLICLFIATNLANGDVFLVPAHPLKKDQIVNADDFLYDNLPNKKNQGYWLESDAFELFYQDQTLPVKTKKDLKEGQLIKKQDLVKVVLKVKKGQKIPVKFIKNNLIIEVSMTALSSGKVGELIKLQNGMGQVVSGVISADGSIILS